MRKVIMIGQEPKEESKGVEFTHRFATYKGWEDIQHKPKAIDKVVYLGKCSIDGDMFACYIGKTIDIYKGHLNNGTY